MLAPLHHHHRKFDVFLRHSSFAKPSLEHLAVSRLGWAPLIWISNRTSIPFQTAWAPGRRKKNTRLKYSQKWNEEDKMKFTEPDSKYWQRHDDGTRERNISEPVFPREKKQQNFFVGKKITEWKAEEIHQRGHCEAWSIATYVPLTCGDFARLYGRLHSDAGPATLCIVCMCQGRVSLYSSLVSPRFFLETSFFFLFFFFEPTIIKSK